MSSHRTRAVSWVAGLAVAATIGLVPSAPAQAEPDIDDVQAKVDRLFREADEASERYNDARLELKHLRKDVGSLSTDEQREKRSLGRVREDVRDSILRQYSGSGLGAFGQVISSGDPGELLTQMSTISAYQGIQQGVLEEYQDGLKELRLRSGATERRATQVAATKRRLGEEKQTVSDKLSEAETLLDRLKDEEREEILSRGSDVRAPSNVPVSGRAGAAIGYAMGKTGNAYVYGAAGPSAFDCSGLTMMAWRQAGVSLPHSSSAQYSSGTRVAASDLQPGDLVFYYSPISHVGMYIGNGMIVHAANPSTGVRVAPLYSMPYVGAVRPG
ncbi:MAG: hypothetical protein CMH83_08670 [Nocardioides sp.]|nr:hypothetical protein [Nocardioides sp.]